MNLAGLIAAGGSPYCPPDHCTTLEIAPTTATDLCNTVRYRYTADGEWQAVTPLWVYYERRYSPTPGEIRMQGEPAPSAATHAPAFIAFRPNGVPANATPFLIRLTAKPPLIGVQPSRVYLTLNPFMMPGLTTAPTTDGGLANAHHAGIALNWADTAYLLRLWAASKFYYDLDRAQWKVPMPPPREDMPSRQELLSAVIDYVTRSAAPPAA